MPETKPKKARKPTTHFYSPEGTKLSLSKSVQVMVGNQMVKFPVMKKEYRDAVIKVVGFEQDNHIRKVVLDSHRPLQGKLLKPGYDNPFCRKCGLDELGCKNPYMEPFGSKNPLLTVVVDAVTQREDMKGRFTEGGTSAIIRSMIESIEGDSELPLSRVRFFPLTLCHAPKGSKKFDYKRKGNWCKIHLVQDLLEHPPKMILAVGTAVLGNLCHKSNAQDWGGKLLTYRGWPDSWITNPAFMKPRPDPCSPTDMIIGHPLLGKKPDVKIPLWPIQHPNVVYAAQSEDVANRWMGHFVDGITLLRDGIPDLDYTRPWYNVLTDVNEIGEALISLIDLLHANPGTLVTFDTETTGLKPWRSKIVTKDPLKEGHIESIADEDFPPKIVFFMFRWDNPTTGKPESLGFPWDYAESPIIEDIEALTPAVLEVLYSAPLCGHNLTFDVLFAYATLEGADLDMIAENGVYDTWHMAFVQKQQPGTLGLEAIAYEHTPDLAGYEEDMVLLIDLEEDLLHPGAGKRGHYSKCPKDKWDSHLIPYVMGDVEVAHRARAKLDKKLSKSKTYKIPLADPNKEADFRWFSPPRRDWVYENIVSPAAVMLTKMMGRGMYVDTKELEHLEQVMPVAVETCRRDFRTKVPEITAWYERKKEELGDEFELDLENKAQLKEILFSREVLDLPITRLTKTGRATYGETPSEWESNSISEEEKLKFAAVDKYTLNHLAVEHKELSYLQEYRQKFKVYSTYIRPLRNFYKPSIDKKPREKTSHLMEDNCIHASFMLTGTRGGRLSCRDPNLQQLPRKTTVKKMFTSRFKKEGLLYGSDLSQIELRIMACVCGDPAMLRAYRENIDLHALTASKIYKRPYETFTKENFEALQREGKSEEAKDLDTKRNIGKTVNFLTGYGGGAFGLQNVLAASQTYLKKEECESIIEAFFSAYPSLRDYLGYYKHFIEKTGTAVSLFGRVRIFEEVFSDDREAKSKALRAGCNHLIQSTASDIMLVCLTHIENCMRKEKLRSLQVSTVHDSLLIDTIRDEVDIVHGIVYKTLNNIPEILEENLPGVDTSWMTVPFAGDSEVGNDYYSMEIIGEKPNWKEVFSLIDKYK